MATGWLLFPSSGNHVTLYPNWDWSRNDDLVVNEHRTRSGKRYRYIWGSTVDIKFTVEFVNSSTAAIVNSWWTSGTKLLFQEEANSANVFSVMIISKNLAIGKYVEPYTDMLKGTIELGGY